MRIQEGAGSIHGLDDREWDELMEMVRRDCSQMLNYMAGTGMALYRGVTRDYHDVFEAEITSNKNPIHPDAPPELTDAVNDWLTKYNFRANRSNCLYVTSYIDQAEMYGTPYIILPHDGFSYTWFANSGDLYNDLVAWLPKGSPKEAVQDFIENSLDDFMISLKPLNGDLTQAMAMGNEIMIANAKFYAFCADVYTVDDLLED